MLRFHFTPVIMVIINKTKNNKCWRRWDAGMGRVEAGPDTSYSLLVERLISPDTKEISMEGS
jgi:hypothetical protein